jgi:hypothetical protein
MIADMTMTVRSMVSHRGARVVGSIMVCTLLHSFERKRAQSRMTQVTGVTLCRPATHSGRDSLSEKSRAEIEAVSYEEQ